MLRRLPVMKMTATEKEPESAERASSEARAGHCNCLSTPRDSLDGVAGGRECIC